MPHLKMIPIKDKLKIGIRNPIFYFEFNTDNWTQGYEGMRDKVWADIRSNHAESIHNRIVEVK